MEILDIIDFLKQKQGKTLDYSKTTIDLINQLYSYIGYLRCDTQKQRQLLLPPVEIWVVEDKDINALVTKIKEEYCISLSGYNRVMELSLRKLPPEGSETHR